MNKFLIAWGRIWSVAEQPQTAWGPIDEFSKFDMVTVSGPLQQQGWPHNLHTHFSGLTVLNYIDILPGGQVPRNNRTPEAWGQAVIDYFNRDQELSGIDFDGMFVDDTNTGAAPLDVVFAMLDYVRSQGFLVVANGGSRDLAWHADYWMSEDFGDPVSSWKGSIQKQVDDLKAVAAAGLKCIAANHRAIADTEANCRTVLDLFLSAVDPVRNMFSWADVWSSPSYGYYPMMDETEPPPPPLECPPGYHYEAVTQTCVEDQPPPQFCCTICVDTCFASQPELDVHMASVHPPPKPTYWARVPMMPTLALAALKKARDHFIRREVHKKLHPLV